MRAAAGNSAAAHAAIKLVLENEDLFGLIITHVLRTHSITAYSNARRITHNFLLTFQTVFCREPPWQHVWLSNMEYELAVFRIYADCKEQRATRQFPRVDFQSDPSCPMEWDALIEDIHNLRCRAEALAPASSANTSTASWHEQEAAAPIPRALSQSFLLSDFRLHVSVKVNTSNELVFCGTSALGTPTKSPASFEGEHTYYFWEVENILNATDYHEASIRFIPAATNPALSPEEVVDVFIEDQEDPDPSYICAYTLTAHISRSDGAVATLGTELDYSPSLDSLVFPLPMLPGLYDEEEQVELEEPMAFMLQLGEVHDMFPEHPMWSESTMRRKYEAAKRRFETPNVSVIDPLKVSLTLPDPPERGQGHHESGGEEDYMASLSLQRLLRLNWAV